MDKPNKFQEVCPRKLNSPPCSACPLAMERINAIKAEGPADKRKKDLDTLPGCPWYISSSGHSFCFWNLANELQDDPRGDREICDMLMINSAMLDKTFTSAIECLEKIKDSEALKALQEAVQASVESKHMDYTTYMPSDFHEIIKTSSLVEDSMSNDSVSEKKVKKRHQMGMPLHRDQKKVDLFGLYSRKSLEKKRKDEEEKGKCLKDEEKEESENNK